MHTALLKKNYPGMASSVFVNQQEIYRPVIGHLQAINLLDNLQWKEAYRKYTRTLLHIFPILILPFINVIQCYAFLKMFLYFFFPIFLISSVSCYHDFPPCEF